MKTFKVIFAWRDSGHETSILTPVSLAIHLRFRPHKQVGVDCKTVRIFAYSSTREQSTKGLDWGWKRGARQGRISVVIFFFWISSTFSFVLLFIVFNVIFYQIIEGNKDSNSVVIYHLKKPFVTKELKIIPDVSRPSICLRTEIYGCRPAGKNITAPFQ